MYCHDEDPEKEVASDIATLFRAVLDEVVIALRGNAVLNVDLARHNILLVYRFVLGNSEFPHDLVPAFSCSAAHQNYNGHHEGLEIIVLVNLDLVNDFRKQIVADDPIYEKQQKNKAAYVNHARHDDDQRVSQDHHIVIYSYYSEYSDNSERL